ncbi:hypothetical protein [Falsiroseomonas tokyonensis]|uniref:Cytochrome C n=1 Tax=Falsiroseomonas tokyonensis TaxID=430521 RepID=A0ABV7BMI8_9PROT|nr:hypothetical protein [Falsiroseomonas tokyonensis]
MLRLIGLLALLAGGAVLGHWLLLQAQQQPGQIGRFAAGTCAACH